MTNTSVAVIESRVQTLTPLAQHKWGTNAQIIKACEEMSELQVQLCKVLNGSPTTSEAIIDEVADALIMVLQMREIFNSDFVDKRASYKLDRLQKALAVL